MSFRSIDSNGDAKSMMFKTDQERTGYLRRIHSCFGCDAVVQFYHGGGKIVPEEGDILFFDGLTQLDSILGQSRRYCRRVLVAEAVCMLRENASVK
jgi:hypothetical protein